MAIVTVGSINIDNVYPVPHFIQPGETLLVTQHSAGLGGKGANQSIAAARAGASVRHVGAIGPDGGWTVAQLAAEGIDTTAIVITEDVTGHAVIQVDRSGENLIMVYSGANLRLTEAQIAAAIDTMQPEDWLLFQNETNMTGEIAALGRAKGVRVAYSAAPFIAEKALPLLDMVDLVCVNTLEAETLADAFGGDISAIPVDNLLITHGAKGAEYRTPDGVTKVSAFKVTAVDTTGAGDTFMGYFLAALDQGGDAQSALTLAAAASAIQVTRPGAADAIPTRVDVDSFLQNQIK